MIKSIFFTTSLFFSLFTFGQEWKMLTPIKLGDFCTDAFVVDDTTAYASTLNGKLYKTINTGVHWTEAHHVMGYPSMSTVWGIHFTDINTGYMSEGNGRIYKTTDAGETWTEVYNDISLILYEIYFTSADTGYACGYPGTVLKTIDAGQNWTIQTTNNTEELRDIWFTDNLTGHIISDQGSIYLTTDGGTNWNQVSSGHPPLFDIEFKDLTNGLTVGNNGTLLITSDGGNTWSTVTSGTTKRLMCVNYKTSNEVVISGADGTILRSLNGGLNYTSEGPNITFDDFWGLAIFNDGTEIAVGDGTMYQLDENSGLWEMKYDEIPEAFFSRVMFTSNDTGHAVGHSEAAFGGRGAIIKTNNGGQLWTTSFSSAVNSGNIYDLSFISSNIGFASSNPAIRTTTNGGNSNWGSVTGPVGSNTAIHFFDQNTGVISTYQGLYKTINGGSNWTLTQGTGTPGFQERFWFIDNDTGYVCGTDVLKTTDGGDSWTYLNVPLGGTLQAIHFPNDSVGYVVGDNGGLKTTDYGASWTSMSGGIPGARDVYFPDPANPDSGYVLLFSGVVQKTIDGGNNWSTVVPAPFDRQFDSFWFQEDYLYAGGSWGDIFSVNMNPQPPIADFTADLTSITPGGTVNFTDLSSKEPYFWEWSFPGSVQGNSYAKNPTGIQYNTLGCYDVTLRVVNAYGEDTITKSCYINVMANTYCIPTISNGTGDGDFIDGVTIGTINNTNTGSTTGPSYNDYTFLSTNLEQNGNYSISITGGNYSPDTYGAWIDYNKNGIFESAEKLGEFITSSTYETQNINFTVPLTASTGSTRLRVFGAYNANGIDPCNNYSWGEVEDYSVVITNVVTSVNKTITINELKLYPNPASTTLNISATNKLTNSTIQIIDVLGNIVNTTTMNSNIKTINISSLAKGMYFVKIEGVDNPYKFIKE